MIGLVRNDTRFTPTTYFREHLRSDMTKPRHWSLSQILAKALALLLDNAVIYHVPNPSSQQSHGPDRMGTLLAIYYCTTISKPVILHHLYL